MLAPYLEGEERGFFSLPKNLLSALGVLVEVFGGEKRRYLVLGASFLIWWRCSNVLMVCGYNQKEQM